VAFACVCLHYSHRAMCAVLMPAAMKLKAHEFLALDPLEVGKLPGKLKSNKKLVKSDGFMQLLEVHHLYLQVKKLSAADDDEDDDDGGGHGGEGGGDDDAKSSAKNARISAAMSLRYKLLRLLEHKREKGASFSSIEVYCALLFLHLYLMLSLLQVWTSPCSLLSRSTPKHVGLCGWTAIL